MGDRVAPCDDVGPLDLIVVRSSSVIMAAAGEGFSDNIKVYVRIRPLIARELSTRECVEVVEREASITLRDADKQFSCRYDHVFTSQRGQEEVWGELRDVVDNVVEGFNTTLFAYGQTGSGKTHTLFGPESEAFKGPNRGIVPRSIGDVFAKLRGSKAVVCVRGCVRACVVVASHSHDVHLRLRIHTDNNGVTRLAG